MNAITPITVDLTAPRRWYAAPFEYRLAAVIACRDSGKTKKETAEILSCTREVIYGFCNQQEIDWGSRRTGEWYVLNDEQRADGIKELRDAGFKRSEIAVWFGVAPRAITDFAREHEIEVLSDSDGPSTIWGVLNNEERIEAIEAAALSGQSAVTVGANLEATSATIIAFAKANGIAIATTDRMSRPPKHAFVEDDRNVDPAVWLPIHGAGHAVHENTGCCWPVDTPADGQRCCGGKVARKSYCFEHYAIAYPKPAPGKELAVKITTGGRHVDARPLAPRPSKKQWRSEDE